MSRVELSPSAEADLADIWVGIATADIGLADRFVDELREVLQKIADQPHMGRLRPELGPGLRMFPHREYLLIYRVQSDGIGVSRVVHGKRDLPNMNFPTSSEE